jgi:predicted nucleic acid-binding protein
VNARAFRTAPSAAYVVDTNLYIRAFREAGFGEQFRAWHARTIARLAMSAVVLHELLVGARDERRQRLLEDAYAVEFRRRGRLIVPSEAVWKRAADADRELRLESRYGEKLTQRSFANDLLIALSCREIGAVVVTANADDFELIRRITGVRHTAELPTAG